jgi:hypothetical protein
MNTWNLIKSKKRNIPAMETIFNNLNRYAVDVPDWSHLMFSFSFENVNAEESILIEAKEEAEAQIEVFLKRLDTIINWKECAYRNEVWHVFPSIKTRIERLKKGKRRVRFDVSFLLQKPRATLIKSTNSIVHALHLS